MQGMLQTTPATTLADAYKTLSTLPLIQPDEFAAFYRAEVNEVRGGDKVSHMALGLRRVYGSAFYKTFLMGHPGVGKSTEMTRLRMMLADRYRVIRFSVQTDLNSAGFQPFDVLLAMMIKLSEETAKTVAAGCAGHHPSDRLIQDIYGWFGTEKSTIVNDTNAGLSGAAGLKPSPVSWASLLGLFAEIKGEIKYTFDRKQEITEYRLHAIAALIHLLNRLLDECNDKINAADATDAINEKRSDYVRRLGTSPYDAQTLTYEDKVNRLLSIYNQEPGNDIPHPVLHSLLRARAVQEFNGERWFGVHPLVVDILKRQGRLKAVVGGEVPGGTD